MTVMMKHVNEPVPDLAQINPAAPRSLVAVTMRALEKDRDRRFKTAAEMSEALRSIDMKGDATGLGVTLPEAVVVGSQGSGSGGTGTPKGSKNAGGGRSMASESGVESKKGGRNAWVASGGLLAGGLACVVLAGVGYFIYSRLNGGQAAPATPVPATLAAPLASPPAQATSTPVPPTPSATPSPSPTATPTEPGDVFVGAWTATDPSDGSSETLQVILQAMGYEVVLVDSGASSCGKDAAGRAKYAAEVDSVGTVEGEVLKTSAAELKCLSVPPVSKTVDILINYTYQAATGTLLDDSSGTAWTRQ